MFNEGKLLLTTSTTSLGAQPNATITDHQSPRTWILENFLQAKLIATSLEGLVHKNNIFLRFQSTYHELIFYNISYCHKGLSKAPTLKKLHSARERSNAKLMTKSVKNRTDCKDEFFRGTSGPQIRKLKTR